MLYDVVLRYVFNAPTSWGNDLNAFLMGGSFVLSIAYAMSTDAHVRVDLLYNEHTRPRLAYVDFIGLTFIVLPAVAFISWGLLEPSRGRHSHRRAYRLGRMEPARVAISRRDADRLRDLHDPDRRRDHQACRGDRGATDHHGRRGSTTMASEQLASMLPQLQCRLVHLPISAKPTGRFSRSPERTS